MIFLLLLLIPCILNASGPVYTHKDPIEQKEWEHIYSLINDIPRVTTGAGVPTEVPRRVGDFYIDTSANKVYSATATVTSNSWVILN